jgi:photosystem II stability/assembly factor-like uncharacterized protein
VRKHLLIFLSLLAARSSSGQTWTALGPPGGDVRTLAVDPARPARVFLGTADGHVFGSEDSGGHWALFGRASTERDAVITAIVVDPRDGNVLFASSWNRDSAAGGGVFRSSDGGRTWSAAGLDGRAVRALALAPSNPNVLVAGTLDGVYRTEDGANSWARISPDGHDELRNLDSLAVDRRDPQIIYAGTFHLPWKTEDGGRTWRPIHEGMIDDSDVMSLLVDAQDPRRIYASACSGIYRSDDGATQWRKIQGIPYTARRTYAITQDPQQPGLVYAATSEGLWKTEDAGMSWRRTTPESWVVNAVVVSAGVPGRVLIGTEQMGVLSSEDRGEHFEEANAGFNHRQIVALGMDISRSGRVMVVLAHAPDGVLATGEDSARWLALGPGLRPEQALRAYAAPDGSWWVSLAGGGLMRYDAAAKVWREAGKMVGALAPASASVSDARGGGAKKRSTGDTKTRVGTGLQPLRDVVTDLAFSSTAWYAATGRGLLFSVDRGNSWRRISVRPLDSLPVESLHVSSDGRGIKAVSLRGLVFSDDGGESWNWHDLPLESGGAVTLHAQRQDENTLVVIARTGLYISRDAGKSWRMASAGLPSAPVQDFAASGALYVAAMRTGGLYVSKDSGWTWDRVPGTLADGLFTAVVPSSEPGVVFAASATEGLYKVEWPASATRH